MQILYERCAGIDIGKDIIAVAVRAPGEGRDGRKTIKRSFKTFYGVLRECARWLTGQGGDACGDGGDRDLFDADVSRAGGPRRVRGAGVQCRACEECAGTQDRLSDAEWLAHLLECG